MNDHAQQLERAFRVGFTSGVAAAGTRLTLTQEQLLLVERWHSRLQSWRDSPVNLYDREWPDIDGGGAP